MHHESAWPVLRNALISFLNTQRPHSTQGFVEIDVTEALVAIRRIQKYTGVAISFHAFALHCMVHAAMAHPAVLTYRYGNKLVGFDDIDVLTPIEKRIARGVRIPVGYIVRRAQRKSLAQLNWELRTAIRADDLAADEAVKLRRSFARLPGVIRNLVSRRAQRDPFLFKRLHGTALLTNFQRHGFTNPAAALGPTSHTLSLAIGSIAERLKRDGRGEIVNRKILMLSCAFDHDIIDGMIVARFIGQMTKLMESADGLNDAFAQETSRFSAAAKKVG